MVICQTLYGLAGPQQMVSISTHTQRNKKIIFVQFPPFRGDSPALDPGAHLFVCPSGGGVHGQRRGKNHLCVPVSPCPCVFRSISSIGSSAEAKNEHRATGQMKGQSIGPPPPRLWPWPVPCQKLPERERDPRTRGLS